MRKFMNKYIRPENGNALVLVMFIILCCTIIMGSVIYITFNQMQYSQAYKKSSNISYLAFSGAEKALNDFNNIINKDITVIINDTISQIATRDILIYESLVAEGIYKISNELFNKELEQQIINHIDQQINKVYTLSFKTNVEDKDYNTIVKVTKLQNIKEIAAYDVHSKTISSTGNVYEVKGTIELTNNISAEIILLQQYDWTTGEKMIIDNYNSVVQIDVDTIKFELKKLKRFDE